jgi:type II secretory pathway pseudopilin PulG
MTMLEIMVVLAIIGGLLLVLMGGNIIKSKATRTREASVEVMATLRAAYNMATMTGLHHRVVFNLDDQVYHVEVCAGQQTLVKGDEEDVVDKEEFEDFQERLQEPVTSDFNQEIIQASSPEDAAAAAAALQGLRVGTTRCQPATKTASGQSSKSGNKHKLDTDFDVSIGVIHVQHITDPVEEGIVSINFFPVGSAEKAIVQIEGADDVVYSVLVFGMTSRVEFRNGEIEADEHMLRDGAGDDVEERK